MANVVVVGAQWGDEGKGKIVDWLSEQADIVVRFQGGHNAGHTLVIDGVTYKLALLPSGVVRGGKLSVIGNGVVVDPWHLVEEIDRIRAQGVEVSPASLRIADNATLRGLGIEEVNAEALLSDLTGIAPKILPYADTVWRLLDDERRTGRRILFEGAQGALLDVDHGTYPFVTSSNIVAAQAATGSGLGPGAIGYVLGIAKAYTTRVGEGPFPTELHDAVGETIGRKGREFGVNTGRKRRCGWFDAVLVRQTVRTSGIDGIALTKLDILDGFDEIRICTGYTLDGQRLDHLPASQAAQARVEAVYEVIPGWSETTAGARSWGELPAQAIKYVRRIEELIGAPVALLSTSPERDDTILMHNPFED